MSAADSPTCLFLTEGLFTPYISGTVRVDTAINSSVAIVVTFLEAPQAEHCRPLNQCFYS